MSSSKSPLGQSNGYTDQYEPGLLFAIERGESRADFVAGDLPFHGYDTWNAWDVTWLGPGDLPVIATLTLKVPASTARLVESKSLKLYLNSFSMSRFDTPAAVAATITSDLTNCTGGSVEADIRLPADSRNDKISTLTGFCLDELSVSCDVFDVDPSLLAADTDETVAEDLYSHLLRSLCPVTGQPDIGSVWIRYHGPRIDRDSLLRYIVSFREHNDFHEACVERMFVDLKTRCGAEKLSVYALYQRRGGIDINPFRSDFEDAPQRLRLWRQ